jgi:hypothetical protein
LGFSLVSHTSQSDRLRISSNPNRRSNPVASFFLELFDAKVGRDVHRCSK